MRPKGDIHDVGVIIGRFQVPELHEAHIDLIRTVCDRHDKVVIFLGMSPLRVTRENPLDFESRKQMILATFPHVNVLYIKDSPSDEAWSKRLDEMIGDVVTPSQTAVLYGGRESFMARYHGGYPTQELEGDTFVSGSEIRKGVGRRSARASEEFRAGIVWAAHSGFPTCFPTVDVAILDENERRILLGRKTDESLFRLIGGFADPRSESYEADARREVQEETGLAITDPVYVTSLVVDDWRYRGEADCIKTLLFKAKVMHGSPRPGDDIAEVRWFEIVDLQADAVVPSHRPLIGALLTNMTSERGERR